MGRKHHTGKGTEVGLLRMCKRTRQNSTWAMGRGAERCWGPDKCARLEVGPGAVPVRARGREEREHGLHKPRSQVGLLWAGLCGLRTCSGDQEGVHS